MSAIALTNRDYIRMDADAGGNLWTAIVGGVAAISALLGVGGSWLFRARDRASADGETVGTLKNKVLTLEELHKAADLRISLRMSALEARHDRVDDQLRQTATKDDVREGLADIKEQIRELSKFIHDRGYRPPNA